MAAQVISDSECPDGLGGLDGLGVDDGCDRSGALPISRRIRLRSWSRICPTMPAAAQRAMKLQKVR